MNIKNLAPLIATVCNLLLLYVVYFLARITYLLVNYSYFSQNLSCHGMARRQRLITLCAAGFI